jgi:hypothetical protein
MALNLVNSFFTPYEFEEVPLTYGSEVKGAFIFLPIDVIAEVARGIFKKHEVV